MMKMMDMTVPFLRGLIIVPAESAFRISHPGIFQNQKTESLWILEFEISARRRGFLQLARAMRQSFAFCSWSFLTLLRIALEVALIVTGKATAKAAQPRTVVNMTVPFVEVMGVSL
nr:MAG TPA: hypothetical protein [Caudoviricetes sp.]